MTDFSHLDALLQRLSHERSRLDQATKPKEIEIRAVWVAGIEKEIAAEYAFLGIEQPSIEDIMMSDDELLAELTA